MVSFVEKNALAISEMLNPQRIFSIKAICEYSEIEGWQQTNIIFNCSSDIDSSDIWTFSISMK